MTVKLSTGLRNAMVGPTGFASTFVNGMIEVYSGPQPISADSPVTGTLLGRITLASGPFAEGSPVNGLTFAAPANGAVGKSGVWSFVGITEGTAGWFRLRGNAADAGAASAVLPRLDGSIASSGADMNLSNTAIKAGAPNTIDSFTFTLPAA